MLSPKIEYFAPETIQEACSLALKYKEEAKIIAGGTDLMLQMKRKEISPRYIINIRGIGQDYITYDDRDGLRIGALATIRSIEVSPLIRERFNILAQAAGQLGSRQVRIRATVGGNLCNAAPSADTIPALMVLAAKIKITGADGERTVSIEDFFAGPLKTVLRPDEILSEIQVPNLNPRSGGAYIKHTIRKAMDLAVIGVAALITMEGDAISDARIALATAAPTAIRARRAEEILKGNKISDNLLGRAGQTALEESSPRDSLRASAYYRGELIKVLVPRAIKQAVQQVEVG